MEMTQLEERRPEQLRAGVHRTAAARCRVSLRPVTIDHLTRHEPLWAAGPSVEPARRNDDVVEEIPGLGYDRQIM